MSLPVLSFAQTDTEFWFAAPEVSAHTNNYDRPIYLRISSYDKPTSVTITQPANTNFTPITLNIGLNSFVSVDLSQFIETIEVKPANQVLDYGIKITSTNSVSIYYEVASTYCNCNPEIYTLKGKNALGTAFYIPAQNEFDNKSTYNPLPYNTFNLVATQANTKITIVPSKDIVGHAAGIPFQITLNEGECYSAQATSQSGVNHLSGSKVTSDKPLAITISDDLVSPSWGSCADLMGDQIVPVNMIGTDYIGVKGFLTNNNDRLYILATQDNTQVFINGSLNPIATLNEGQTFSYTFGNSNLVFVHADKPVYVLHLTGNGCELSHSLLPQIVCTGSQQVTFTRTTSMECYLMLITKNGNQTGFQINGSSSLINGASFSVVPGTNNEWVAARLQFDLNQIPIGTPTIVNNTKGVFHLGFMNGNTTGGGCRYGYFSSYNAYLPIIEPKSLCIGDSTEFQLSDPSLLTSVIWNFDDPVSLQNSSTRFNPRHLYQKVGSYNVSAIYHYECGADTVFHKITISELPIPTINGLTEAYLGNSVADYSTESDMTNYHWTVSTGGSFAGGEGTNTIAIEWNSVGNQTVSVQYVQNNGCSIPISASKDVVVLPMKLKIPEGFSPNGDGINDFLVFSGLENYLNSKLTIYSRSGYIVFDSDNYLNDWNGENIIQGSTKSAVVLSGTYYYILKLGGTNQTVKGFILIAH
ncbi:MAG: gliding motility-associated C-terminal domain-containing protein [Mariniphaga sp.]